MSNIEKINNTLSSAEKKTDNTLFSVGEKNVYMEAQKELSKILKKMGRPRYLQNIPDLGWYLRDFSGKTKRTCESLPDWYINTTLLSIHEEFAYRTHPVQSISRFLDCEIVSLEIYDFIKKYKILKGSFNYLIIYVGIPLDYH